MPALEDAAIRFLFEARTEPLQRNLHRASGALRDFQDKSWRQTGEMARRMGMSAKRFVGLGGIMGAVSGAPGVRQAVGAMRLAGAGLARLAGPLGVAAGGVMSLTASFLDTQQRLDVFRRGVGMTRDEMLDMHGDVLDVARRYGTAMSRIADLSSFVAQGARRSSREIAELAGRADLLAAATGSSAEGIIQLDLRLRDSLGLTDEQAQQTMFAIRRLSSNVRADYGQMTEAVNRHVDAIRRIEGTDQVEMLNQVAIALTAARSLGPDALQGVESALDGLLRGTGRFGMTFRRQFDDNVVAALRAMNDEVNRLVPHFDRLTTEQVGEVLSGFGIDVDQAQAVRRLFSEAGDRLTEARRDIEVVGRMTPDEIQKAFDGMLSPTQRIERSWGRITGAMSHILSEIAPALDVTLRGIANVIERITGVDGPWSWAVSFMEWWDRTFRGVPDPDRVASRDIMQQMRNEPDPGRRLHILMGTEGIWDAAVDPRRSEDGRARVTEPQFGIPERVLGPAPAVKEEGPRRFDRDAIGFPEAPTPTMETPRTVVPQDDGMSSAIYLIGERIVAAVERQTREQEKRDRNAAMGLGSRRSDPLTDLIGMGAV